MVSKKIIALDGDGVLVDYHAAYQAAWGRAFGTIPAIRDPLAYWPLDRFDVRRLTGNELVHFRSHFDAEYWATIPAIPGAIEACHLLSAAGYELICVSAIDEQYQPSRLKNLIDCGFPIKRVIATENSEAGTSPKAAVLKELNPVAFVDDFLPYLRGIPANIHSALILREPNGSPNTRIELDLAHSQHADLLDFTNWWLRNK